MDLITISRRHSYEGVIESYSSQDTDLKGIQNILRDGGYWSSARRSSPAVEFFTVDFNELVFFNFIELFPAPHGGGAFPNTFRFECSDDKITWEILHEERDFVMESGSYLLELPLIHTRYCKVVILKTNAEANYTEIGRCVVGISGVTEITATSSISDTKGAGNLLLGGTDACWESEIREESAPESITVDMGRIFHVNRILLYSAENGFPSDFFVETSTDGDVWSHIFEEKNFVSQPLTRYGWNVNLAPARFVRIDMQGVSMKEKQYGVKMASIEIAAAPFARLHTHNIGQLTPYASIFQPGVVKLSKDGETLAGTAVQGNDGRLKDSSTIFKGIVRLAEHGECAQGIAVQSSDPRLGIATELTPGIVRLCYDRENKQGSVVQGSDSRLQEASEKSFGTVRICPDGQYNERTVVQGNDSRLQKATAKSYGICKLAPSGGTSSDSVVQADDRRLKEATTKSRGIVELAEDGEDAPNVAVQGDDRRLKNATIRSRGIVELAENGEDAANVAVQGDDRRLKNATTKSLGIVELAENGEDAANVAVQGDDRRLKDATTKSRGIVELAENGEDAANVAVQGDDRRLKDATTKTKGIVELAEDGEDAPNVAVQGNDRRLKNATTLSKGIVELAEDAEDAPNVAVQGDDRRLKDATTKTKGIVELAEDGEDAPNVAVQGNDRRLRDATASSRGIVELAEDGEAAPLKAVQGDDRRLKNATTFARGIVELAEDGEDAPNVAVQGNDRRLKNSTTKSKGIVELAEDGEDAPNVAVQGNDRRLKDASDERRGIVQLAKNEEKRKGLAVQADDRRLTDPREPLPHGHDYAPLKHEFGSHGGTLSIKASKQETFREITPPSDGSSVISGCNDSKESGAIGVTGVSGLLGKGAQSYGVVGHSRHVGVRGQSSGNDSMKGCGVMGISRFGAGGVFASEHDYSLVVDGYGSIESYDNSANLAGNGDALSVRGKSDFHGPIYLNNAPDKTDTEFPANIVELFEVDDQEFIAPGDLLVVSQAGKGVLSRSRSEYNKSVVGVIAGNSMVIINNSGKKEKVYPVALSGKALCRVDARQKPVKPGDLIVTSGTPGCGMAGSVDSFEKIGTVIGKALDGLEEGTGLVPVFIVHL